MLLAAAAALLSGCATAPVEPPNPPPRMAIAVLDFRVPDEWRAQPASRPTRAMTAAGFLGETEAPDRINKELRGWWFGSRDIWRNPGMGRVAADIFSHELNQLPFVKIVSRVDIKYYMAEKRQIIRRLRDQQRSKLEKSPNPRDRQLAERIAKMTEADYDRELERLPVREIGRELGADRVLVGRIIDAYQAHNRTIHWYWSVVELQLELVDVDTGKVVWHKHARFKKSFASTTFLLEAAARELIEAMKREYFFQQQL